MDNNNKPSSKKTETIKVERSHSGGYEPGSDALNEFTRLGSTSGLFGSQDYDAGLVSGLNQEDYIARQQGT